MKREITEFNLITIVETSSFTKEAKKLISEEEIDEVKNYLASNPEVGDLIPGLRGIRKMRWQANQKGKRGGARIIYFFYNFNIPLFLLDIYPKSKKDDLTPSEKKDLNNLIEELVNHYGE
jgi:mRNA-degrading endonuclease RelE of RelBE toxin-antitoxin system